VPFITMELVEGKTLADVIPDDGVTLGEFFDLAVPLTDALHTAHERGVVHRDLKPANIMITAEGRLKILDFGLAKLREVVEEGEATPRSEDRTHTLMTQAGQVMGTMPYMSPEQCQGKPLDHRTDIFSVGVIFHEMATGKRPFTGESSADLISSILRDAPAPVSESKVDFPNHLSRIIRHCLEKDPERRYQTAKDVRNDLQDLKREVTSGELPRKIVPPRRRIHPVLALASLAVVVALVGLGWWMFQRTDTPSPTVPAATAGAVQESIAVLAFVDMSEKHDQEYFADGLAEELMGMLSKVSELKVPARTSSFYFKGKQVTIADIAKSLGVAHVLEGSVRKSGDTLRISVELIRADNGYRVWSNTYDRRLDDIFKVQDEIASAVVKALKVSILEVEMPKAAPAANQEAYALYLQARSLHYRGTHADNQQAIRYLERALELDPTYAPAWFRLADTLVYDYGLAGGSYQDVHARARAAAETALRLDPKLSDAHLAMGRVLGELEWNWTAADVELKRTLELDPNNVLGLSIAAGYALIGDRLDEALRFNQAAAARDAVDGGISVGTGDVQIRRGRLPEAESAYRKAIELSPTSAGVHASLGVVLLARGEPAAALAAMEQETDEGLRLYGLALAFGALGRQSDADRALAALETKYADGMAVIIASVYADRKQLDRAFTWLDRAFRQRDGRLPFIKLFPGIENLAPDPRYKGLLQKLNLPE
jgi:TolB-like protein